MCSVFNYQSLIISLSYDLFYVYYLTYRRTKIQLCDETQVRFRILITEFNFTELFAVESIIVLL